MRHRPHVATTPPSDPQPSTSPATNLSDTDAPTESMFECNVCFDTPHDPVVTPCGHLYCWPCLYRWMRLHPESPQCPVCKAAVDKHTVIPIYGRGRSESDDPRERALPDDDLPPRPAGQRQTAPQQPGMHAAPAFRMHPAFGRVNPYGPNYENISLSTFGLFPSLFGLQIAYPHMNERRREQPPPNPEVDIQEQGWLSLFSLTLFDIISNTNSFFLHSFESIHLSRIVHRCCNHTLLNIYSSRCISTLEFLIHSTICPAHDGLVISDFATN